MKIGSEDNLSQKVVRLSIILPQLDGLSGTLHLETWTPETTDIIWDRAEEQSETEEETTEEPSEEPSADTPAEEQPAQDVPAYTGRRAAASRKCTGGGYAASGTIKTVKKLDFFLKKRLICCRKNYIIVYKS